MKTPKDKERDRRWYLANQERIKAKARQWYRNHRERTKDNVKKWQEKNIDKKRAYARKHFNEWRKAHKEEFKKLSKKYRIYERYKITHDEWMAMWNAQGGKCWICQNDFVSPLETHTDHDHKTGIVRGLLCKRCNLGLGWFMDNSDFLERASMYLRRIEKEDERKN